MLAHSTRYPPHYQSIHFLDPPSNLAYKAIITHYKNYKKYYMRRGQCGCSIPKKEAWAR